MRIIIMMIIIIKLIRIITVTRIRILMTVIRIGIVIIRIMTVTVTVIRILTIIITIHTGPHSAPGMIPYFDLTTDQMVTTHVCAGGRLRRDQCVLPCPDALWDVLEQCWAERAADRPRFAELGVVLGLVVIE